MMALLNKYYSGHRKVTEKDSNREIPQRRSGEEMLTAGFRYNYRAVRRKVTCGLFISPNIVHSEAL